MVQEPVEHDIFTNRDRLRTVSDVDSVAKIVIWTKGDILWRTGYGDIQLTSVLNFVIL